MPRIIIQLSVPLFLISVCPLKKPSKALLFHRSTSIVNFVFAPNRQLNRHSGPLSDWQRIALGLLLPT